MSLWICGSALDQKRHEIGDLEIFQCVTELNNAQQSLIIVSERDLKRHNRIKA